MIRWLRNLFSSRDHAHTSSAVLERVEATKAEFEAAVRLWPRDRAAVTRTWERFRDARCEQLRGELGR